MVYVFTAAAAEKEQGIMNPLPKIPRVIAKNNPHLRTRRKREIHLTRRTRRRLRQTRRTRRTSQKTKSRMLILPFEQLN